MHLMQDASYMYKRSSNVIVLQNILSEEIMQHILSKKIASLSDMEKYRDIELYL